MRIELRSGFAFTLSLLVAAGAAASCSSEPDTGNTQTPNDGGAGPAGGGPGATGGAETGGTGGAETGGTTGGGTGGTGAAGSGGTGGSTGGTGGASGGTGGAAGEGTGGTGAGGSGGTAGSSGGGGSGNCVAHPVSSEFTLRWADEFDAWDGNRWQKNNHTFGENLARFDDAGAVVEDGYLKLLLTNNPIDDRQYRSAEVQTRDTFQYGRFDTCVRWGRGSGIVASFFTYFCCDWEEIDIEYLGGNTVGVQYNLIWNQGGGNQYDVHYDVTDWDGADEFHHYAIEWVPGEVRMYIDGEHRYTYSGNSAAQMTTETTLRMNLWPTDSGFAGNFDPGAIPTESWYDWVRVYDYNG